MWADLDLAQARWRVVCQWLDAGSGIDRGAAWAAVADGDSGACGRGAGQVALRAGPGCLHWAQ
jgi:hypothetical protein